MPAGEKKTVIDGKELRPNPNVPATVWELWATLPTQTLPQRGARPVKRLVALAQALLPQPELLILDEPSDGLDPEGIHEMRQTILRLHRELRLTILLSSHFLNEVEQTCTRIAVLRQGRKVFEGDINAAKSHGKWLRVRVNDFAAATRRLQDAQLITDTRDGSLVSLRHAPGF